VAEGWTFLSNHGHVLVCLSLDPDARLRDVAERVGITDRAVQQIVSDLEAAAYLSKTKTGRRNRYRVRRTGRFRHPLERQVTVGDFLDLVTSTEPRS
jgi:predicted transcriptional regulator